MTTKTETIFFDEEIPSSAKILYVYMVNNKVKEATNEQLAVKFNVTSVSISNWLSKLEERDYIKLSYSKRKRLIHLN